MEIYIYLGTALIKVKWLCFVFKKYVLLRAIGHKAISNLPTSLWWFMLILQESLILQY